MRGRAKGVPDKAKRGWEAERDTQRSVCSRMLSKQRGARERLRGWGGGHRESGSGRS